MRRSTLIWTVLCLAVVIGLFVIKHRVQDLEDRLHSLNAEILSDRDATQVLEAEWSYLNQPARLESLSRKLLGMEPPTADQTVTLEELRRQLTPEEDDTGTEIAETAPVPKRAPDRAEDEDWLKPILARMRKER